MGVLDISTARGQKTVEQEKRAAELFERRYPRLTYCHTSKASIAAVDAMLIKFDALRCDVVGVVESKCRNMTYGEFKERFTLQWLVTAEKIDKGRLVADLLQAPFFGFLYLVSDDALLVKRLYDPERGWLVEMIRKTTETQATVNGGIAHRENAFIDMSQAQIMEG